MSYRKARKKELKKEQFYKQAVKTLRRFDNKFSSKNYNLSKPLSSGQKSAISRAYNAVKDQPYQNYKYVKIPKYRGETKDKYEKRVKSIKQEYGQFGDHKFNGVFFQGAEHLNYRINKQGELSSGAFKPVPGEDYVTKELIVGADSWIFLDEERAVEYIIDMMEQYKFDVIWPLYHGGQIHASGGFAYDVCPDDLVDAILDVADRYKEKIKKNVTEYLTGFKMQWYIEV